MAKPQYGREHQVSRARSLSSAYGKRCPGCGKRMLPGQQLDWSHSVAVVTDPAAKADHWQHASCNRSDGARLSNARRRLKPSRPW